MEGSIEQRYAIKFCFRLGKTATQTLSLIKEAYKDEALSKAQVFRWHSEFRNGRESVEDLERAGRPTTVTSDETVTKVRNLLNSDRRLSLRLMAAELDMNHTTVHKIVTEQLGMRKICAKLVPRVLSDEQKQRRVECCQEMLNLMNSEPDFEDDVITGDESWVFQYDPETKRQSAEWHTPASPRPKKARMSKSKVKTMLIVFFDNLGVVHKEFVPPGQSVNAAFYKKVLERLHRSVKRKRPEIASRWKLHHDNAPAHTAFVVTSFLTRIGVEVLPQPPYSPDVSPADFFLFPKLKSRLKGTRFEDVTAIQADVTKFLKDMPDADFQGAFAAWKHRLQKCIDARGEYFESF